MSPINRFISFAVAFLLSACGFHLKGSLPHFMLPVNTWSVQGGVLQSHLETALRQNQGVLSQENQSQAHIRVVSYENRKDIYTITRAAKLNEYLLSVRVVAQAYRHGKEWGQPILVKVERVMPYTDSMILGKQYEEDTIWQEIQQDAAEQIVRQMAFLKDE